MLDRKCPILSRVGSTLKIVMEVGPLSGMLLGIHIMYHVDYRDLGQE
jgi:hypothetical protein